MPEPQKDVSESTVRKEHEQAVPNRKIPTEIDTPAKDTPQSPDKAERGGKELPAVSEADVRRREDAKRRAWQEEHNKPRGE